MNTAEKGVSFPLLLAKALGRLLCVQSIHHLAPCLPWLFCISLARHLPNTSPWFSLSVSRPVPTRRFLLLHLFWLLWKNGSATGERIRNNELRIRIRNLQ